MLIKSYLVWIKHNVVSLLVPLVLLSFVTLAEESNKEAEKKVGAFSY